MPKYTSQWRWLGVLALVLILAGGVGVGGCDDDPAEGELLCDPASPGACPSGFMCLTYGAEYRCYSELMGVCGNGVLEPGEQCDASDFDGSVCVDFGFDDATLRCDIDCTVICPICGNGLVEQLGDGSGEQCDDGNLDSGDGCSAECQLE